MHYLSFPSLDAQIHIVYNHYKGIHHVTIQHLEEKAFLLTYQRSAGPILKVSPIHCLESHAVEDDLCCDR